MAQVLRLRAVLDATGLSRSSIHRLEAAGHFPRRIRIGIRAVAWKAEQVADWVESRQQVTVRTRSCADVEAAQ
jgi:prophage regulatory protein